MLNSHRSPFADLFMDFAGTLVMLAVVRSFDTPGAAAWSAATR